MLWWFLLYAIFLFSRRSDPNMDYVAHAPQPQFRMENMNKDAFHENWYVKAMTFDKKQMKENFLSDPATYPLVVIFTFMMAMHLSMPVYALSNYRDVRIDPSFKHSELQERDDSHFRSLVEIIGTRNKRFEPIHYEGLGVDHQEWLKRKETERQELERDADEKLRKAIQAEESDNQSGSS